jgi:hypothetical protein
VLAISYEPAATLEPFLTANAWTMPVGSDPEKATISAYSVHSWPTTVVIDKEGKVAHVGSPYDAEAAVEKALGLEAGPGALLTAYFDSLKANKADQRQALDRLVEKATPDFDLQSWARGHLEPETVAADESSPPAKEPPADAKSGNAADLLRRCAQAWSEEAQRTDLLQQLGDRGPTAFDLGAFAMEAMQSSFPFTAAELKALLQKKKFGAVLDAIATRAPSAPVLAAAAKNGGLADYCKKKVDDTRLMAKKGLMAQLWVFPGALPRDSKLNEQFWGELAVSGMATSKDKKSIVGVLLDGELVNADQAEHFVRNQLEHAVLMDDLATKKTPRLADLRRNVEREQATMVRDLESRYGKPAPAKPH